MHEADHRGEVRVLASVSGASISPARSAPGSVSPSARAAGARRRTARRSSSRTAGWRAGAPAAASATAPHGDEPGERIGEQPPRGRDDPRDLERVPQALPQRRPREEVGVVGERPGPSTACGVRVQRLIAAMYGNGTHEEDERPDQRRRDEGPARARSARSAGSLLEHLDPEVLHRRVELGVRHRIELRAGEVLGLVVPAQRRLLRVASGPRPPSRSPASPSSIPRWRAAPGPRATDVLHELEREVRLLAVGEDADRLRPAHRALLGDHPVELGLAEPRRHPFAAADQDVDLARGERGLRGDHLAHLRPRRASRRAARRSPAGRPRSDRPSPCRARWRRGR
jgi:hypothetical protein